MANKLTGTGVQFQQLSSDPGSPVSGQVYYNTSDNELRQYNGSEWSAVGSGSGGGGTFTIATSAPSGTPPEGSEWWNPDTTKLYKYIAIRSGESGGTSLWRDMAGNSSSVTITAGSWKNKHIYAQCYTLAGYKDSTSWKNVNRTIVATDVTTNLGDRLDRTQGYCDGGWDDVGEICYGHGMGNNVQAAHNYTSSYNMRTDAGLGGAANMTHARNDCGVAVDMDNRTGYIGGGGNDTFTKMSYTTSTGVTGTSFGGGVGSTHQATASFGQLNGWFNIVSTGKKIVFATDTASGWSRAYGQTGCQKGFSSKNGYFLSGRDGACGSDSGFDEYSDADGSFRWHGAKPLNCGEENYSMAQDKGYMLGQYDGLQNNKAFNWVYASRSGTVGGSSMQPKGHDGMSSGFGCSRKG